MEAFNVQKKTEWETLKLKLIGKFVAQLYSVQRKNCDKSLIFVTLSEGGWGIWKGPLTTLSLSKGVVCQSKVWEWGGREV